MFWKNFSRCARQGVNAVMHGSILPVTIPPGQPREQVQHFGPGGWGIVWSRLVPGGGGRGKSKITSCCSCEVRHFSVDYGPRGEDCLFPGRISRVCSRLVREEKYLKIIISIRRYFYFKLLNKCAFDAYSNGWHLSQTKKYFFSEFKLMYILRRLK